MSNSVALSILGVLLLSGIVLIECFGMLFRRVLRNPLAPSTKPKSPYFREDWFDASSRAFRFLVSRELDFTPDQSMIRVAKIGRAALVATLLAGAVLVAPVVFEVLLSR